YAELVFVPELWPDVDRRVLWRAITEYARGDRRYGGAIDAPDEEPTAGWAVCADGPPAVMGVVQERASWAVSADSAASCGSTSAAEMPPVRRLCRSSTATSVTTRASTATAPQGETRNSSNQA